MKGGKRIMIHSKNTVAIPPGATIREQLDLRGMAQKEFSLRMGMSEKHISRLINGKVELTPDVALRLESVLGMPAKFWNNLESIYREQIARVEADMDDEQEQEFVLKFPYAKLANAGIVPKTRIRQEKILYLRRFF
jgi:HTH-type transcriptional regulator/antitoxin HigA